jgi:hypothetical protein
MFAKNQTNRSEINYNSIDQLNLRDQEKHFTTSPEELALYQDSISSLCTVGYPLSLRESFVLKLE